MNELYYNLDIKFSGITVIRYTQNPKIGKSNNLKLGEQENKGLKHYSQIQLRSLVLEGREP
jgi:hypothetical protein